MPTERHYTHSIVSYATLEEIRRLLEKAKHWAYIYHDRDEGKSPHFHIVATFATEKSFKWVREQVQSTQNTFSEAIKGEISDVLAYFTHKGFDEKFQYEEDDVVYSNRDYWKRRVNNGEDEENKNEAFMDDLLSCDFSAEAMGRKYGRDFIKNYYSYYSFRMMVLNERKARCEELDFIKESTTLIDDNGVVHDGVFRVIDGKVYQQKYITRNEKGEIIEQ